VQDPTTLRVMRDELIGREVDLDLGQSWRVRRPSVGESPECRRVSRRLRRRTKDRSIDDELEAGVFCEPCRDLGEDRSEVFGRFRSAPEDGEVEILREAVGLVVALAEAGPRL
jgi:hypothetical protein